MSVKGVFLRCLGGSCLLQNTEQGRPGGGGGGGGGEGLGLPGQEDPPAHPSLGWGICLTFSLWLWDGPLFLPGELLGLAPPGLWGEAPSLPQARKDTASPWQLSKLRFGGSCGQPKSSVWTWGG